MDGNGTGVQRLIRTGWNTLHKGSTAVFAASRAVVVVASLGLLILLSAASILACGTYTLPVSDSAAEEGTPTAPAQVSLVPSTPPTVTPQAPPAAIPVVPQTIAPTRAPSVVPTSFPTPVPAHLIAMFDEIDALPWVKDGISENDGIMVANLRRLAKVSEPAFRSIMSRTWIATQDQDFTWSEQWVVRDSAHLAENDTELAEQLVEMSVVETIDIPDEIAINKIVELFDNDRQALRHILALPEFAGGITDELAPLIPLFYLDTLDPEAAEAIRSLHWVGDGRPSRRDERSVDTEPETIEGLQTLAKLHPNVFWAVIASEWMRHASRGSTWDRAILVTFLIQIADVDEESALRILDLPFLDTVEYDDVFVMAFLRDLAKDNLPEARRLLSNPALQDPDMGSTTADIYPLFLKTQGPEIAAGVESLRSVQDGVDPVYDYIEPSHISNAHHETEALWHLTELYLQAPEVFLSTVRRPWVQDAIGIEEKTAIVNLLYLTSRDPESASRIAAMAFLDIVTKDDLSILQTLRDLSRGNSPALRRILSDPALSDGITNNDLGTLVLLVLREEDREAARVIEALPWVRNGISPYEESALLQLRGTALNADQLFPRLMQKPWVRDGLTNDELAVVEELSWLSRTAYRGWTRRSFSDEPTALQILDMPFLETVDGIDAAATYSLGASFWFEDTNYLEEIMAHPRVSDGITDDEAPVIAAMQMVLSNSPRHLDDLLELPLDTVEERVVSLPYSSEVAISVVNLNPGNYRTIDILEESLRRQEEFI